MATAVAVTRTLGQLRSLSKISSVATVEKPMGVSFHQRMLVLGLSLGCTVICNIQEM
jgi:hypothetical protein